MIFVSLSERALKSSLPPSRLKPHFMSEILRAPLLLIRMPKPHHLRVDAGAIIVNSEQQVVIIDKLDD